MERNFETVMIEQCAPVLASLKPAGLFRYETRDCADLARRVKNWNTQLNPKGLRVRVLKGCVLNHRYLVYVYRESRLATVLADEKVQSFLTESTALVNEYYSIQELQEEVLSESIRLDHSSYDMFYFVLARRFGATLFTLDRKLIRLCEEQGVQCVAILENGEF